MKRVMHTGEMAIVRIVAKLMIVTSTLAYADWESSALAQASVLDHEVCTADLIDARVPELNRRIFACSKVASDGAVPAEARSEAYMNRGATYQIRSTNSTDKDGDVTRAIKDFVDAIQLNPRNGLAYLHRGTMFLIDRPDYDKAIADFSRAIALNARPENAAPGIAYELRGSAYEKKGNMELAIADFRKALSMGDVSDETKESLKRSEGKP